jgi:hypothetical protein
MCGGPTKIPLFHLFERSAEFFSLSLSFAMGVNGQKRKNKQGPVPTLEESLPKKFKSSKITKSKKSENGLETAPAAVPKPGTIPSSTKSVLKTTPSVDQSIDDNVEDERVFGKTKASLFDDDDEEVVEDLGLDEFEGLDGDVDM